MLSKLTWRAVICGGAGIVALCALVAYVLAAGARVNPERETLTWDAPTTNVDGSVCDDLSGYVLAVTSQDVADLNAGGTIIEAFAVGTNLYSLASLDIPDGPVRFWVKAIDLAGNESVWSEFLDLELDATKPGAPGRPKRN